MVFVQNASRLSDVDRTLLRQAPGQLDQPIQVGPHHAVFARCLRHPLQPAQFLARVLVDLLRHFSFGDRLIELGHFGGLTLFALAKLALDRSHLLAQQDFALTFAEGGLGLLADLLRQSQDFNAMGEHARDFLHPRCDVDGLQDLLLLVRRHVHIHRRKIGKGSWGIDALDHCQQFRGRLRQQLHGLRGLALQMKEACLDFGRSRVRLWNPQDVRNEKRPSGKEFRNLEPLVTLTDEMVCAIRRSDVAHDIRHRTHPVHVDRRRIAHICTPLHQDADLPLLAHRLLGSSDRPLPADRDRQHVAWKQNGIADRNDNERVRRQWGHRHCSPARALVRCAQKLCLSHGKPPIFSR